MNYRVMIFSSPAFAWCLVTSELSNYWNNLSQEYYRGLERKQLRVEGPSGLRDYETTRLLTTGLPEWGAGSMWEKAKCNCNRNSEGEIRNPTNLKEASRKVRKGRKGILNRLSTLIWR